MLPVREDFMLLREEGSSRVNQIDARKPILKSDLLCAEVLLHGDWVVCAALDGCVVCHDDAPSSFDHPDSGDDARAGDFAAIKAVSGERRKLEKSRTRIEERVNAVPRQEFAALHVPHAGGLRATFGGPLEFPVEVIEHFVMQTDVLQKLLV
jgi:hypothetical protein